MRAVADDTELRRTAPDLFAFVLFPLHNNACKIPAGGSRQSCVPEASRDVGDVAGVDRCSLDMNECFRFPRFRNRNFFDLQHRRRSEFSKT
ncbi:MAG: hypothetical protein DMG82_05240 [Acidobacteria bacterium]|nr:MAG: hypothetical protein DMG82_05240 [Acidobacteriota bacterium]PYX45348.1 MAG: hypothetical protein DMG83_10120 [Acidobacteriota bacterium]